MTASTIKLDTAEECARWLRHSDGVTPRLIHQWARRGKIKRHPGDLYDAMEIVKFLKEGRDTRMMDVRRGVRRAGQSRDTVPPSPACPEAGDNKDPGADSSTSTVCALNH